MQVRLDKWLWCVRVFKTRSQATDALRGGKVKINGEVVKPSRETKIGDTISYRRGVIHKEIEVKALLDKRVGAKLVENYVIDHTPESEYIKAKMQRDIVFARRDRGTGRPTKKERRDLEKWGDWD
ncbi:RNA-binding S4 domain-containing protein [Luteibaculum oceani]|uniref:RNA-binding S4 domain-containing protein n=1 Tax=Luteibaculum oceani TaxID=1294296 RepID=A0A5C6V4E4_9FLAO|nr:RNA-binding S4 domain-containing protein [Luteibaculum oceani]TXC78608.1 RNA-binding S4 domain-containing protein [Luteibaculum oceani]